MGKAQGRADSVKGAVVLPTYTEHVSWLCSSYAKWYVTIFGGTSLVLSANAALKGAYLEAACQSLLSLGCFIVPPYLAEHNPMRIGLAWCLLDSFKGLCLMLYSVFGTESFRSINRAGITFCIVLEIAFGPYHQAEYCYTLISCLSVSLGYGIYYWQHGESYPLLRFLAIFISCSLAALYVDRWRRKDLAARQRHILATRAPDSFPLLCARDAGTSSQAHASAQQAALAFVASSPAAPDAAADPQPVHASGDSALYPAAPEVSNYEEARGAATSAPWPQSAPTAGTIGVRAMDDTAQEIYVPEVEEEEISLLDTLLNDHMEVNPHRYIRYNSAELTRLASFSSLLDKVEDGAVVFCNTCGTSGAMGPTHGCAECDAGAAYCSLGSEVSDVVIKQMAGEKLRKMHTLGQCHTFKLVHVAIPYSDPNELNNQVFSRMPELFRERSPMELIMQATVRRGSLLVALDMISAGGISSRRGDADVVPSSVWLQWLQLPWPKDGADVMVQVDSNVHTLQWDQSLDQWVEKDCRPITEHVTNAERCMLTDVYPLVSVVKGSMPTSSRQRVAVNDSAHANKHVISLEGNTDYTTVDLTVVSRHDFSQEVEPGVPGVPQLKARFHGRDVPLSIKLVDPPMQAECQARNEGELQHLVTLHLDEVIAGERGFYPGLAVLEFWMDRLVVQSVPLLLLYNHQEAMCAELGGRSLRMETMPGCGLGHPVESFTAKMGLWLGYLSWTERTALQRDIMSAAGGGAMDQLRRGLLEDNCFIADIQGMSHTLEMSLTMMGMAQALLEHAVANAWVAVAAELMYALVEVCGCSFRALLQGGNVEGFSLLHLAVSSGKVGMIAQVLCWCSKYKIPCSWCARSIHMDTPLHIAVMHDDRARLSNAILRRFDEARMVWFTARDKLGMTPAVMASHLGVDIDTSSFSKKTRSKGKQLSRAVYNAPGAVGNSRSRLSKGSVPTRRDTARELFEGIGPDTGADLDGMECEQLGLEPIIYEHDITAWDPTAGRNPVLRPSTINIPLIKPNQDEPVIRANWDSDEHVASVQQYKKVDCDAEMLILKQAKAICMPAVEEPLTDTASEVKPDRDLLDQSNLFTVVITFIITIVSMIADLLVSVLKLSSPQALLRAEGPAYQDVKKLSKHQGGAVHAPSKRTSSAAQPVTE